MRHLVLKATPDYRDKRARIPDHFEFKMLDEEKQSTIRQTDAGLSHLWQKMQEEVKMYEADNSISLKKEQT